MGNQIEGSNGKPDRSLEKEPGTGGSRHERPEGNSSPRTETDGRTPAGGRTGTGGKTEEKAQGLKLAAVEGAPTPAEPKKKTKRKPKPKKKDDTAFSAEQIASLIMGVSSIVASRENYNIWQLTQQEAEQIATPIANMIEKSEKLKAVGEHADAIALVTACIMVIMPRAIAQMEINKQKPKKKEGVKLAKQKQQIDRSSRESDRARPSNVVGDAKDISSSIPAIL